MNIEKILSRCGNSVYLGGSDGWHSSYFKAFIQPLRYKTKLYMVGERTPIGNNHNDVYLYIGPPSHDLTKLNSTYRIYDFEKTAFSIDRAEKITVNNEVVYIWAIIRKVVEGDL